MAGSAVGEARPPLELRSLRFRHGTRVGLNVDVGERTGRAEAERRAVLLSAPHRRRCAHTLPCRTYAQ